MDVSAPTIMKNKVKGVNFKTVTKIILIKNKQIEIFCLVNQVLTLFKMEGAKYLPSRYKVFHCNFYKYRIIPQNFRTLRSAPFAILM